MNDEHEPQDLRDIQPSSFRHVIGQSHVSEALQIAVEASFQGGKQLDDTLLCGPPGLGKTAIVMVLAQELAVPFTGGVGPEHHQRRRVEQCAAFGLGRDSVLGRDSSAQRRQSAFIAASVGQAAHLPEWRQVRSLDPGCSVHFDWSNDRSRWHH